MSDGKKWSTIRVPEKAVNEAREAKLSSETWADYVRRCADTEPEIREFVDVEDVLEDRPNRSAVDVLNRLDDLETHLDRRLDEVLRG